MAETRKHYVEESRLTPTDWTADGQPRQFLREPLERSGNHGTIALARKALVQRKREMSSNGGGYFCTGNRQEGYTCQMGDQWRRIEVVTVTEATGEDAGGRF